MEDKFIISVFLSSVIRGAFSSKIQKVAKSLNKFDRGIEKDRVLP
jgi:hypothetical protein